MAASLYTPRPACWFQFSLRGLLLLTTVSAILTATVLPSAIATYRQAREMDELAERLRLVSCRTSQNGLRDIERDPFVADSIIVETQNNSE